MQTEILGKVGRGENYSCKLQQKDRNSEKKPGFKMISRRELNGRNCLQNKNYEGGLVQSS